MGALSASVSGASAASAVGGEVGVPVSYLHHTYATTTPPTADKPQSKLWYHDGSWWALMVEEAGTRVTVHELRADHTWRNTGAVVDNRSGSTGDALWSARDTRLYVAGRAPGSELQVNALTYDSSTRSWAVSAGFPTTVSSGGASESASIDQDSLGRLWVTYTRASRVWVAHSDAQQGSWTEGFQPSVNDTTIAADDLSAVIAFGTSVGVMYSDQQSGGFHFAIHDDADPADVWRAEHIDDMPYMADDHINLKQLAGDPQGRVFAAIKTSAEAAPGAQPSDPLVGVLTRTPGADGSGNWRFAPAGTIADDHTRPFLMIDATNQELYFFATAPGKGGDIYYKKTPLSDVDFGTGAGRGTRFIDVAPLVNNASGSKDPVTATTGMVVLAVAHGKKRYVHGEMRLEGGGTPTPPRPSNEAPTVTAKTPSGSSVDVSVSTHVTATFSEPVQGVFGAFALTTVDGTPVPASVSEGSDNSWTLDPNADLAPGTKYTATLVGGSSAIRDLDNDPLSPETISWSFTTAAAAGAGDGVPPTVTGSVPAVDARGVGLAITLKVTFSEPVQGVVADTFTLVDSATGSPITATVKQGSTPKIWFLDPTSNLSKDRWHTVTLTGGQSGIQDLSGTPLATTGWRFLTGPPPKVSSRSPKVNATGVGTTTQVTVKFSEAVENVATGTYFLTDPSGTRVPATVARVGSTSSWVLQPDSPLASRTKYAVSVEGGVSGITDLVGNPLRTATWSFTTG